MFRNYFLTAWRNPTRNKVYTVLNILRLSIGMAVALLIGQSLRIDDKQDLTVAAIIRVLVSCVVASPVAYYLLDGWLHKYSYRITIGPGVFVIAAAMG